MVWVRRGVTIILILLALALLFVFGGTEVLFRRHVSLDLPNIDAATRPVDIAEGERLGRLEGCVGCHGARGQGQLLIDDPTIGRVVAPSLARVAQEASDGQLAWAIRNGVGVDARPLYVMPSDALNKLSDEDVARLIGWIRALKPLPGDMIGGTMAGPVGRIDMLIGRLPSAVDGADGQPHRRPADVGTYLVATACAQCHGIGHDRLIGPEKRAAPPLAPLVASRDVAALAALLRDGGNYHAGMAALHDDEIAAIKTSLQRPARGLAAN